MNTRTARALLVVAPLLGLLACSNSGGHQSAQDGVGAVGLALQVAPGTILESVGYQITGPGGFTRSGSIGVRQSARVAAIIGGLPAGAGHAIVLSAIATGGGTSCSGNASFDVVARETASVNVNLVCLEAPRTGSVQVNGVLNVCPVVDGVAALPAEVIVGRSVALVATAHDSDVGPAPLAYQWSAPSGTFSAPTSASSNFTCTSTGAVTVTVTVGDGDPAPGCPGSLSAVITCSADEVLTRPYPGITLIKRTDTIPLPAPARQVKMNLVLVDLKAPEVHFKMTPPGENLPPDNFGTAGWPTPYPPFEVVRQRTVDFLEDAHGQVAINSHFFAPFPVPPGSDQGNWAYLIGLAASRGKVYSGFETPFQIYAIVPDSPAINIDRENNASVVHRDPAFADGKHVLESVTLWNALSGSGQIITDGVKSIPMYRDATHPDAPLIGPGNANYSNSNSWYNLINARSAVGLTQDKRTLVLFTVDVRPSSGPDRSQGMRVGEVADVLLGYGVWNALNLDGGGSTSMAMQDPADGVRKVINVSSDPAPGRAEASNLAVYSDGIPPVTTAVASPAANPNGWNNSAVSVGLDATDLRNGASGNLPGWVDQLQYSLAGAQAGDPQIVPGHAASLAVTASGITTLSYFATDAAGNDEGTRTLTLRLDVTAPAIEGLPPAGCSLSPANGSLVPVAVVAATDALSGLAPGSLQVSASSSDPAAPGDPDVRVTSDGAGGLAVALRAARPGRVYTLSATARDLADNVRTATATCVVAGP